MGPAFPRAERMSIKQPSYFIHVPVYDMTSSLQVLLWTWCIAALGLTEDVQNGVPILKEINRVNDDGSYTFGYEAADGSFKIETRDVQGNVKGMFGYIDDAGELKRVSYTANNGTGYQSVTTTSKPTESSDRTETKRPVFILRNPTSTRPPVIQHIPRKNDRDEPSKSTTTPVYGEYINGRKPVMEIILNSATSNLEENRDQNREGRPTPTQPSLRRILVTKRPIEDTALHHGKGGNSLRRQLNNEQLSRPADTPDIYPEDGHARFPTQATRFQNPLLSSLLPQATPAYRNHILSQNSGRIPPYLLRPEYPNIDPTHQPPFDPHEPPEITTTVAPVPQSFPTQHRLYPEGLLPHATLARKFRPNLPLDEQQYPVTSGQDPRQFRQLPNLPQISSVLQQRPMYPPESDYSHGPQISAVQSLRDELMEYLLQFLQQRTGRTNSVYPNRLPSPSQYYNPGYNPYYQNPNQNQYFPNPQVPYNPYPNQYGPYPNQNPFYNPYINQNLPFQNPNAIYPNTFPAPQPFVPPVGVPPGLTPGNPYSTVPYSNPNIQHSSQQQVTQQSVPAQNYSPQLTEARIGSPIYRNIRPPSSVSDNDISQQELFRMLAAASTRATPTQSYSPTTEIPKRSTQPVRNIQILGAASETVTQRVLSNSSLGSTPEPVTQKVTTATPIEDEMEQIS